MQCVTATLTSRGGVARQAQPGPAPGLLVRAAAQPDRRGLDAGRRAAILGGIGLGLSLGLGAANPQPAQAAGTSAPVPVKEYLPAAPGLDGFCIYKPDDRKTPSIRAGVIKPEPEFYSFAVPDSWAEAPLVNPLTGQFCMPRCEEPWYEFKFENPKEGSVQLICAELQKLGAKPTASLRDLGPPEQVVQRIGNFITGFGVPDEEDIQAAAVQKFGDGREYYVYEVYSPYSKAGGHQLAAFTTKNGIAYIFVATASDRQWGANEGKLRTMLTSFKA